MATVAQLDKIASFKPGVHKGRTFTSDYLKAAYDTFKEYSTGDKPYYTPFLNINHKDEYRHGSIVKANVDADGTLDLWADKIPEFIGKDVEEGRLAECSIEFFEPTEINGKIDGFFKPDGTLETRPVIRCLSLLGSESPAVKGLGGLPKPKYKDVPAAKFNDRAVARFSDKPSGVTKMSQELLDQLKALNFDIALIPADATDDLLKAIIAALQAKNANPTNPTQTAEPATTMSTGTNAAVNATGSGTPAPSAAPLAAAGLNPSQITTVTKFYDEQFAAFKKDVLGAVGDLNTLKATNEAIVRNAQQRLNDDKRAAISRFFDECGIGKGRTGQITPAMQPAIERALMKCDHAAVRKFSDNSGNGTELQEEMAALRKSLPVIKGSGQHIKQPAPADPNSQTRTGSRERILSGSVYGQTILKQEAAAAKKK